MHRCFTVGLAEQSRYKRRVCHTPVHGRSSRFKWSLYYQINRVRCTRPFDLKSVSSFFSFSLYAQVVMDNGILLVNLSKPEGMVVGIQYQGIDNLLEVLQDETNRGYLLLATVSCHDIILFIYLFILESKIILVDQCYYCNLNNTLWNEAFSVFNARIYVNYNDSHYLQFNPLVQGI